MSKVQTAHSITNKERRGLMNNITSVILLAAPFLVPIVILMVIVSVAVITVPRFIKRLVRFRARSRMVSIGRNINIETFPMYCVGDRLKFLGHRGGYRNTARVVGVTDLGYELYRSGSRFSRPFGEVQAA